MTTEHLYYKYRPSSRTRVFRVLESLSISDSFLNSQLIVVGATHSSSSIFAKACAEHSANIHLQNKKVNSSWMRFLPVPRPINFVVTFDNVRHLVDFIRSIDEYLIVKLIFVEKNNSHDVIKLLSRSASPIQEGCCTIGSNCFIYGFDFDAEDAGNPVVELYAYSSLPADLKIYFD